jgi:hypothetical protein
MPISESISLKKLTSGAGRFIMAKAGVKKRIRGEASKIA